MSTIIIASVFVGAVLQLRFRVFALIPMIVVAWVVLTAIGLIWGIATTRIALEIVVVTTALQFGYLGSVLMDCLRGYPVMSDRTYSAAIATKLQSPRG